MYLYILRTIIQLYKNTNAIPLKFRKHYLSNKKKMYGNCYSSFSKVIKKLLVITATFDNMI